MKPGIHPRLTFPKYLALDRWGSGSLRAMRRGPPARVVWERDNPKQDTDATILGSAVHCLVLTPGLFVSKYSVKPEGMTFASKEGKAWRDDPSRVGVTILSTETFRTAEKIYDALVSKQAVFESLEDAEHKEVSLLWDCPITREPCKARPDWIEGKYIYDLKVSRHAGGDRLAVRAFVEGWMHQLSHYRTGAVVLGLPVIGGRLVVVEPTPPHFVYTLEVKIDALDLLDIENIETLKLLRECRLSGSWPGTPEEWVKCEPPAAATAGLGDVIVGEELNEDTGELLV